MDPPAIEVVPDRYPCPWTERRVEGEVVPIPTLPPKYEMPDTERGWGGVVVPIPTLPWESIVRAVLVANADVVVEMRKSGVDAPAAPAMESRA